MLAFNIGQTLLRLWNDSGVNAFFVDDGWKSLVMIAIACVFLYLGIVKKFEPLLLVGIAFGCLLSNLPMGGLPDGGNALGECVACFRAQGLGQEAGGSAAASSVPGGRDLRWVRRWAWCLSAASPAPPPAYMRQGPLPWERSCPCSRSDSAE